MKFWNYIGEFFLFRWMFGRHNQRQKDVSTPITRQSFNSSYDDNQDDFMNKSSKYYHGYSHHNAYNENDYRWNHQSFDDFHEEQDDYDMMDDF